MYEGPVFTAQKSFFILHIETKFQSTSGSNQLITSKSINRKEIIIKTNLLSSCSIGLLSTALETFCSDFLWNYGFSKYFLYNVGASLRSKWRFGFVALLYHSVIMLWIFAVG